jgi:hypothetical protein
MKLGLNVLGLLGFLIGGVWTLQGLNILEGSFMSGQTRWLDIGAVCAVASVVLLAWVNWWRR